MLFDEAALAAETSSSLSVSERIAVLHRGASALASVGLSWCRSETKPDLPDLGVSLSADSEEFKQLLRVKSRVDDIARLIIREGDVGSLNISCLVDLVWSFAIVGLVNREFLLRARQRIQTLAATSDLSPATSVKLLFAEASLYHQHAAIDVWFDEETFKKFPPADQANALLALGLVGRHAELAKRLKRILVSSLVHAEDKSSVAYIAPFAVRACLLVSALEGDDGHHEVSKLKSAFPELTKRTSKVTWKYSFELCLACHAAVSRGVELNPVVESAYPADVLFVPPKGKKKIVIELVRSSALVREDHEVVGVDAYTRAMRIVLASKGYRIVAITLGEWLALDGDKNKQLSFVKRRIRNCLRQRRLVTGMERDESLISDSGSDSDMSY